MTDDLKNVVPIGRARELKEQMDAAWNRYCEAREMYAKRRTKRLGTAMRLSLNKFNRLKKKYDSYG